MLRVGLECFAIGFHRLIIPTVQRVTGGEFHPGIGELQRREALKAGGGGGIVADQKPETAQVVFQHFLAAKR